LKSIEIDGIEYRFFNHLYAVSQCGKVLRKMELYAPPLRADGYLSLGRQRLMHRVIAACWLPNERGAKHVHHKNGDKTDNRADNLEWLTPKEHFGDRHEGNSGRYTRTEATREKYRAYRLGKKDSEETRAKKAAILAINCPKRPSKFNGVVYPSASAGARAAGIHLATFRLRCLSKNFPEYELI
jgi:hypothetical protein